MNIFRLLPAIVCCMGPLTAAELTEENMTWAKGQIVPQPGETSWWSDIQWEIDLDTALDKANAKGRPVFLWEMDGHPLGCT